MVRSSLNFVNMKDSDSCSVLIKNVIEKKKLLGWKESGRDDWNQNLRELRLKFGSFWGGL